MKLTINAEDLNTITFGEKDRLKSIAQNVGIILSTFKGSVPLFREFGISSDEIDRPSSIATAIISAKVRDAILEYEPRVEEATVYPEVTETGVRVIVEVEVKDEQ